MQRVILSLLVYFLAINLSMAAVNKRHNGSTHSAVNRGEQLKTASKEAQQENISWPRPDIPTRIYSIQKHGYVSLGISDDRLVIRKGTSDLSDWIFETNMTNGQSYNGIFTIKHSLYRTGEFALRLVQKHDKLIPKNATQEEAARVVLKRCGDNIRLKLVSGLYISALSRRRYLKLGLVEDEGCMQEDEATHKINMMRRPDTEFILTQPQY